MAIDVAWLEVQLPSTAIVTDGVAVSWIELRLPTSSAVIRSMTASQTVGAFTQTAAATTSASGAVDVAWLELQLPEGATGTRNLSANQTVDSFGQSASMYDIIGQISGGGTISDELPHRSATAAQQVGSFQQSAYIGNDSLPAPNLMSAFQQVGSFTTAAAMDAQRTITASQTVESFGQSAYIGDRPETEKRRGAGGGRIRARTYSAIVAGRRITASSLKSLQRMIARFESAMQAQAEAEADIAVMTPRAAPKVPTIVIEDVPDAPVDELARVMAEAADANARMQTMYSQAMEAATERAIQQAQYMQARMTQILSDASTVQQEADALWAMLLDGPAPLQTAQVPVPVLMPREMPPKPAPKKKFVLEDNLRNMLADVLDSAVQEAFRDGAIETKRGEVEKLESMVADVSSRLERAKSPRRVVRDDAGVAVAIESAEGTKRVLRDDSGRIVGLQDGDEVKRVQRDESGRIVGI